MREYDQRRFLSNFSHQELSERFCDIVSNSVSLQGNPARLGPHTDVGRRSYWGRKLAHVRREFQLRGERPRFKELEIPSTRDTRTQAAAQLCEKVGAPPSDALVKYGEYRYLKDLLDHGRVLIRPASFYARTDLAQAIRDDELRFDRVVAADRLPPLTALDGTTRQVKAANVRPKSMLVSSQMETDYYLYCLSSAWDPRLFLMDPRYDAALVMHKPQPLFLIDAAVTRHGPAFHPFRPFEVDYVDPVEARDEDCTLPVCKHFRYALQQEIRKVWWPTEPAAELAELTVEVGPLGQWATLVRL